MGLVDAGGAVGVDQGADVLLQAGVGVAQQGPEARLRGLLALVGDDLHVGAGRERCPEQDGDHRALLGGGRAERLHVGAARAELRGVLAVPERAVQVGVSGQEQGLHLGLAQCLDHVVQAVARPLGLAALLSVVGEQRQGGQVAGAAFSTAGKEIVVNRVVSTQAEADALAQSLCEEMGGDFIQAEGVCAGDPAVCAGAMVELKGLSDRFKGRYRITHALHHYDAKGYVTRFTISGRHDNTLAELVSRQSGGSGSHSVVVGIVTNNQDPNGKGRVKVKFPWLAGDTESHWARIASPMAGKNRGMVFLPEVNDEVLLAFEHGDLNRPYVLGALWNGMDEPPEGNKDGKNNIRKICSRSGHEIIFNDDSTARKEKIEVHTKAGHKILLDDSAGQEKIEIKDKTGKNVIKMDSVQNSITLSSAMKLDIDAQMIELKAKGMMTLKAGATLTIQGAMVKIN